MRILITGATGLVGRALTLRLRRDGHEVVAWVRSLARARDLLGDEATLIEAPREAADDVALRRAVDAADAIVNLAGEPIFDGRWSAARQRDLVSSRVDLTKRLVAALAVAGKRPRALVSASAVGFYGDRGDERLDETSQPGDDFLARLCRDWEAAASAATAHGVRVAIVRVGIVLARDGGALAKMLPPFRAGVGGPLGSGRQYMSWIHLDDLVEALASAAVDARYEGVLNGVAPAPVTNRALSSAIGRALHRPSLFPVPGFALKLLLGPSAEALLGGQQVLPSRLQALGFQHRHATIDAALADLLGPQDNPAIASLSSSSDGAAPLPSDDYLKNHPPRYRLEATTLVDAPLAEVFAFFSKPANLGLLTPSSLAFSIQGAPPTTMATGTIIDYTIRIGPLAMNWRTRIAAWHPGASFADTQEKGPYASWWHEHRFRADGDRTIMEDRVYYAPPLGLLGRLANALFIAPMLRRIFSYRASSIRLRFATVAQASRAAA